MSDSLDRSEGYQAYISDTAGGWARNTVHIVIGRPYSDGRFEFVNLDGTITVHDVGARLPDDAGWEVPRGAVHAVAEAIERWQGDTGHAATEVRVLREVLKKEQARVDSILETERATT